MFELKLIGHSDPFVHDDMLYMNDVCSIMIVLSCNSKQDIGHKCKFMVHTHGKIAEGTQFNVTYTM